MNLTDIVEVRCPADLSRLCSDAVKAINYYVDLGNKVLGVKLPYPKVTFDIKGRCGGYAHPMQNKIQLNPTFLRENPQHFCKQTTGHEVAHLLAHAKYGHGIKAHGREWQSIMYVLGLPCDRCHSYDTSNVPSQIGKHPNKVITSYKTPSGNVTPFTFGKITNLE